MQVLTLDVWHAKDVTGTTVLAVTVVNGKAGQVPEKYLLAENLLIPDTAGSTVLHYLAKFGEQDNILGVELPESCEAIVGKKWFESNRLFIVGNKSKEVLDKKDPSGTHDLEMF